MLGGRVHIINAKRHEFPAPHIDASTDGAGQLWWNVGFGIIEAPFERALARTFAKREYVGMAVIDDETGACGLRSTKALVETVEPWHQ